MTTIDKLIFDKLAAGQGINLPDVGALYVEREPAKFISRSEIRPPQNKVLFSRRRAEDFDSVIDLLMAADNVKRAEATQTYREWLAKSKESKDLVEMNSVGVLTNDFFYPSALLHDTLNPAGGEPVALRRNRSGNGRTWIIAALSVLGAAVVALYILFGLHMCSGPECKAVAEDRQVAQQDNKAVVESATVVAETEEQSVEDVIQQGLEEYAQDLAAVAPAVVEKPSVPLHYVVVGVFVKESNADQLIEDDYLMVGRDAYAKMPYRNRTMVTVFSSPDIRAAYARREELLDLDYDIWVYTK